MQWTVTDHRSGTRLDIFLLETGRFVSRHQVQKLVQAGSVLVDGLSSKASCRLRAGQQVTANLPDPEPCHTVPECIPLHIVYEDPDLLVVDKPAGMVVHPGAGHRRNTLVNALLHHCTDLSGIGGVLRPGIVHRLDKTTSGLLVVAKGDEVHQALCSQFQHHTVTRAYVGLVHGTPPAEAGRYDAPIGRHPVNRKKMSSHARKGKPAITEWKVLRRFGAFTLLRFILHTGRTHQIRVHTSEAGFPMVGDDVYGRRRNGRGGTRLSGAEKQAIQGLDRVFLHAEVLGFIHPHTGRPLRFHSSLPLELVKLLERLEPLDPAGHHEPGV